MMVQAIHEHEKNLHTPMRFRADCPLCVHCRERGLDEVDVFDPKAC